MRHDRGITFLEAIFIFAIVITMCLITISCSPKNGKDGIQGLPGLPGTPAEPISVSTLPASLAECPTGGTKVQVGTSSYLSCNGATGLTGADGQTIIGPQGPAGSNGTNGIDATPITIVQFCIATPSYPTSFPEVGICLGGNLYAVYSQYDGFLVYVPPGVYHSHAVGSSCNFTVAANCQISH